MAMVVVVLMAMTMSVSVAMNIFGHVDFLSPKNEAEDEGYLGQNHAQRVESWVFVWNKTNFSLSEGAILPTKLGKLTSL